MKQKLKTNLPWLAICAALFLLLPLAATGDAAMIFFIGALYLLFPAASFVCALLPALRAGFCWPVPLIIGGLFLPCVYIYYNESALVYVLVIAVCAFAGEVVGWAVWRGAKKRAARMEKA